MHECMYVCRAWDGLDTSSYFLHNNVSEFRLYLHSVRGASASVV